MNQSDRISGMLMFKPGAGVIRRFHRLNELHHLVFQKNTDPSVTDASRREHFSLSVNPLGRYVRTLCGGVKAGG